MIDRLETAPAGPKPHIVPPGTREVGMWLFLISLTLLFVASLVGYTVFRLMAMQDRTNRPAVSAAAENLGDPLPLGSLELPDLLWVSTGVIILTGFTMQRALNLVRRERIPAFRHMLMLTLGLSLLFVLVQTPALFELLMDRDLSVNGALNGFLFFLITLHALHVIGGMVPLVRITIAAHADRYDHEHYGPVKSLTMYWHFLDAVWIAMFGLFLLLEHVGPMVEGAINAEG